MGQKARYVKSQYKCIRGYNSTDKTVGVTFHVNAKGVSMGKFLTERAAAIAYDIYLIRHGKKPINILKKKQSKVKLKS